MVHPLADPANVVLPTIYLHEQNRNLLHSIGPITFPLETVQFIVSSESSSSFVETFLLKHLSRSAVIGEKTNIWF